MTPETIKRFEAETGQTLIPPLKNPDELDHRIRRINYNNAFLEWLEAENIKLRNAIIEMASQMESIDDDHLELIEKIKGE